MPSENPRVTVLMAVYNRVSFLSESIESILNQSFSDFEFLIVDDGSTDDSCKIIADYALKDPRIILLSQGNRGLTKSLNRGVFAARGEYLARMDDDDVSLPDRLEKQVKYLDGNPETVAIGGQVTLIDERGLLVTTSTQSGSLGGLHSNHTDIDRDLLNGHWPLVHPACTFRIDALRAINGYNENYKCIQDHDLFLRLAEVGKLNNLREEVLKYRRHPNQITSASGPRRNYEYKMELIKAWIRRAAYKRRRLKLPPDLSIIALIRLYLKSKYSHNTAFIFLLKAYAFFKSFVSKPH